MTGFIPPEDPPPEVAEHLRHLNEDRVREWCLFCQRRRIKGGTGVRPEDYLPPVPIGDVQDVVGGLVGMLRTPTAYVDTLSTQVEVRDGHFICNRTPGRHCDHWTYTGQTCCKCHATKATEEACKW